jgi:hypothetical protein
LASRLDPYGRQPPAAPAYSARPEALVREEGELLLVSYGARLADVCVKCAARDRIVRRFEVMRYRPNFWCGWRYGGLDLPLCPACDARWRGLVRARFLAALAMIPVLVVSAVVVKLDRPGSPFGGRSSHIALALVVAWLVGLVVTYARPSRKRTVGAKAIVDENILLRGVHPDARRALVIEAAAAAGVRRIPPER